MIRDTSRITDLVLHCSASPNGRSVPLTEIDSWHRARGFKRSVSAINRDPRRLTSIGYHRVIQPSGAIEQGREFDEVGAHCPRPEDLDGLDQEAAIYPGNSRSIGLCLVGTDQFTPEQWGALRGEVQDLMAIFPIVRVWSHHQLTTAKLCPCFSARDWLAGGMEPMPGHVLGVTAAVG